MSGDEPGRMPDHSALSDLEAAVRLHPGSVKDRLKLGDVLLKVGRIAEACDHLEVVAEAYSNDGFWLKSAAIYKQILKWDAMRGTAHEQLARIYDSLGMASDAAEHRQWASSEPASAAVSRVCSFCDDESREPLFQGSSGSICIDCLRSADAALR